MARAPVQKERREVAREAAALAEIARLKGLGIGQAKPLQLMARVGRALVRLEDAGLAEAERGSPLPRVARHAYFSFGSVAASSAAMMW